MPRMLHSDGPGRITDQEQAEAVEGMLSGDKQCPDCRKWVKKLIFYVNCPDCFRETLLKLGAFPP